MRCLTRVLGAASCTANSLPLSALFGMAGSGRRAGPEGTGAGASLSKRRLGPPGCSVGLGGFGPKESLNFTLTSSLSPGRRQTSGAAVNMAWSEARYEANPNLNRRLHLHHMGIITECRSKSMHGVGFFYGWLLRPTRKPGGDDTRNSAPELRCARSNKEQQQGYDEGINSQ